MHGQYELSEEWLPTRNEALPMLLRAIANGADAKASRHDIILNAAADELDELRSMPHPKGTET